MSDDDDVRERVEAFVDRNPDAGVMDVLARGGVDPAHRPTVRDVLGVDQADAGGVEDGDRADDATESGEPGGESDAENADSPDSGDTEARRTDSRDANPTPDTPESGSSDDGIATDAAAPVVAGGEYPSNLLDAERWLAWKLAPGERKVPRAPWSTGDDAFVSAQDPAVWTDLETVREWIDTLPGYGTAFNIRDREEFPGERIVLVDYDDARDPETGRIHPTVRKHIERAGSYADVSTSGTGVHILARGALPEGVPAIDGPLPSDPEGQLTEAEIEVYDSGRYVAMTGDHLAATPTEVRDAQAFVDHLADEFATVAEGTPDEAIREPEKTREEVRNVETTSRMQDVYDAIEHTNPRDIRLRSPVTNERASGVTSRDPAWRDSKSGTGLAELDGGWIERKGNHGLDALQVVALEDGIISRPDEYPSGEDFRKAVDALRDRGAHIPEHENPDALRGVGEPVAVLPDSPEIQAATTDEWWQESNAGADEPTISRPELWERVQGAQIQAMWNGEAIVLDAIMGGGKTFNFFAALAERGEKGAYFAPRVELYEQAVDYARENGLGDDETHILPSIERHCPTWNGEYGEEQKQLVQDLHGLGVQPKTIHNVLGDELGCRQNESGECEYEHRAAFDPDDYQVLIGHYAHANLPQVTAGRHVAFDEEPAGAFKQRLEGRDLTRAVNAFLGLEKSPPFDGFDDLIQHRNDPDRREAGLDWFDRPEFDFKPDEQNAVRFKDEGFHAYAPLAVYAILDAEPIDDGYSFERGSVPDPDGGFSTGAQFFTTSEEEDAYHVEFQDPPDLGYTRSVIALDGTPLLDDEGEPVEWRNALGRPDLRHERVLTDDQRAMFLSETQGNVYLQSSPYIKPYSGGEYAQQKQDAAKLAAFREFYGDGDPATVFTGIKVENQYEKAGFVDRDLAETIDHPGNLRGSDEYGDTRLAVQLGSSHHGDHEIRRRAAWLGETVEPSGRGRDRDYGRIGNAVLRQMREAQSAQNALRVGRDGDGALFIFDTCAFPDWIPVEDELATVSLWSDTEQAIREAWDRELGAIDGDGVRTDSVAAAVKIDVSDRHLRRALGRLGDKGLLEKHDDPDDARRNVWRDTGLCEIDADATADLDLPDLGVTGDSSGSGDTDISRINTNTWNVRNHVGKKTRTLGADYEEVPEGVAAEVDGGDPPPG
jgi:hypothetical protein